MEEEEDLGGVGITLRQGEEVEVVMADVEILYRLVATVRDIERDRYIYAFM